MGTDDEAAQWIGGLLARGLESAIVSPSDILAVVTPKLLAEHLPPTVMAEVLSTALGKGSMSPESVLDVAGPLVLAAHVPAELLWKVVTMGVHGSGLHKSGHQTTAAQSTFLSDSLGAALEDKLINPDELIYHATPAVLCASLPIAKQTALLEAGLASKTMTPQLIVDTVTVEGLAKHLPSHVLWAVIAELQAVKEEDVSPAKAKSAPKKAAASAAARRKATPAPARGRSRVPAASRNSKIKRSATSSRRTSTRSASKK